MKQFFCGDVVPGCTKVFEAEDEQGLFQQIAHHAASDHGITEVTPELVEQVRSLIRSESA